MKSMVLASLLFCALGAATISLFGDGSYSRMQTLKRNLSSQQDKNVELKSQVSKLEEEVYGIQNDARVLEKAARNELGLARPDERIIIFEKSAN